MQQRKAQRGEKFEGHRVTFWVDTEEACNVFECTAKTLASWRAHGLPARRREPDATWWYPWPMAFQWYLAKTIREAQGLELGYLPYYLAKATADLAQAEDEARADVEEGKWVPPASRERTSKAGRYSYRQQQTQGRARR